MEKGSVTHRKGALRWAEPALCPEPDSGELSPSWDYVGS